MKKISLLLLPIITLVLEILPFGAVLIFAPSPTERVRETFSYFSLTPFGYANFAPFITAVLTCAVLIFALASIKKSGLRKTVFVLSLAAAIISLAPLISGAEYYTLTGAAITLTLAAECAVARINGK